MWKVCITQLTFPLELFLVKRVLGSGLMAQIFCIRKMLCQLSLTQGKRLKLVGELVKSELKGKGFCRLRDAKPVRQNELYANILIELNNNVTVKNLNTNIGNVMSLS